MALGTSQSTAYQKLLSMGTSQQAVSVTDSAVRALIYISARDLGILDSLPAPGGNVPELFDDKFVADFTLPGTAPRELYEMALDADAEMQTYISCLASLHKYRLKYREVLASQPFATMDQVGPRALLQFNQLAPAPLAALLVWRKWFYDIDNRAAQDTGYLFEPVIAAAIGGAPISASKSPIRRSGDKSKGRQIDCLKVDVAYEIKIRITIAASGQGRWTEELTFPAEARACNIKPVLIVLDPTPNVKLTELSNAYLSAGGEVHIGDDAWKHLKSEGSPEMAIFLDKYIRQPIEQIFSARPENEPLPTFQAVDRTSSIEFKVGSDKWSVPRNVDPELASEPDKMPEDASDFLPGISALA